MTVDWLRLWHDMPTDPKWRTIARRAQADISEVMAVYLFVLTNASQSEERGTLQNFDTEDVATALDIEDETVKAIVGAMQGKVLEGEQVRGWEKRQPKREDDSTGRVRAYRDRQKGNEENAQAPTATAQETPSPSQTDNATPETVTQCNTVKHTVTQSNAREEERREDIAIRKATADTPHSPPPRSALRLDSRFECLKKLKTDQRPLADWLEDWFWKRYPVGRKTSMPEVWKAAQQTLLRDWGDEKRQRVEACLEAWIVCSDWQKAGGQYVPAPEAWLRRLPWDGDLPSPEPLAVRLASPHSSQTFRPRRKTRAEMEAEIDEHFDLIEAAARTASGATHHAPGGATYAPGGTHHATR